MNAKSRFRFECLIVVGTTCILLTGLPAPAQQMAPNHLDCWFDEALNAVQCPSDSLQEGRGARIDPDRVDRAFDVLDPPEPAIAPPGAQPLPEPRPAQAEGTRTERTRTDRARTERARTARPRTARSSRNPGCRNYRTYNPATQTYRGYDGVVRQCRPDR